MESFGEYADIQVGNDENDALLIPNINVALPTGMTVTGIERIPLHAPSLSEDILGFHYRLYLPDTVGTDRDASILAGIDHFIAKKTVVIKRVKKGKTMLKDIRPLVKDIRLDASRRFIELHVACEPAGMVRPADILTEVFDFDRETGRGVRIVKQETIFR
jgi:radical SAM-linked protein